MLGATHTDQVASGIYIIAATTALQLTAQQAAGLTSLTQSIVDALRPDAASERIWVRNLADRIKQSLPRISAEMGVESTPLFISKGIDFPIGMG
jgi:hypothetical protein